MVSDIFMNSESRRQHFSGTRVEADLYGLNDECVHTCTCIISVYGLNDERVHTCIRMQRLGWFGSMITLEAYVLLRPLLAKHLVLHCVCMYLQFLACVFLIQIVKADL